MELSELLKITRQKAFMTQEDFAADIHVSVPTINRWENGRTRPSLSAMKTIKDFCNRNQLSYDEIEKAWFESAVKEKRQ